MSSFQNVEYKIEKKLICTIFLIQFKLGQKAAETAHDINEVFGPGTTTERTAQWWFKKFCGGNKSLEDDERSSRPSDVYNDQLRANPCTTVWELASELDVMYTTISNFLREIGKTKKLDKWVPHKLSNNQKKRRYEVSSSLLLRNKNDPFLDWVVTCDEKCVLYDNWLSSVVRCRQSSTTLPEARVTSKEGHADCLVVCDRSHLLQFFEYRRNHYGGEVLSTNGWNASETSTTTPNIS